MKVRGNAERQLAIAAGMLGFLLIGGAIGFHLIESWSWLDSTYTAVIILSTVGYGVRPLSSGGEAFAIGLTVCGVGTVAYAFGTISRIMVEGYVGRVLGDRRLKRLVMRKKGYYIVCGYGRMGRIICQEFERGKIPFVVIEKDEKALAELAEEKVPVIRGDATRNEVLLQAGIEKAAGLVSVVSSDAENVYIVLTARGLNPKLNIVARAGDSHAEQKLLRAGATRVISPYVIGGMRIAQAVLRPAVMDFIELATTSEHLELQIEEIRVPAGSPLEGKTLVESELRKQYGVIVVSVLKAGGHMEFNPSHMTALEGGDTIIVLGERSRIRELSNMASREESK